MPPWVKALFGAGVLAGGSLAFAAVSKWRADRAQATVVPVVPETPEVARPDGEQPRDVAQERALAQPMADGQPDSFAHRHVEQPPVVEQPTEVARTESFALPDDRERPKVGARSQVHAPPPVAGRAAIHPPAAPTQRGPGPQRGASGVVSIGTEMASSPPTESALAREARLLQRAVDALRARGDARSALAELDALRAELPDGQLAFESLRVRVEALQALARTADAIAELRSARARMDPRSARAAETFMLEGELLRGAGRCDQAIAAFTQGLLADASAAAAERGRRGIQHCRELQGVEEHVDPDLPEPSR